MIGRPDSRASMITPRPTVRERFGTSAVSATLQSSSSARISSLNAPTPPLRWNAEPFGGDRVVLAVAVQGDQDLGDVTFLGLDEWVRKCWPCQNAKIAGNCR